MLYNNTISLPLIPSIPPTPYYNNVLENKEIQCNNKGYMLNTPYTLKRNHVVSVGQ